MKFTIARTTLAVITTSVDEINALNGEETCASAGVLAIASELNALEHFSVTLPGDELVVEVNDEVVLRMLSLYMKTARLVAPVIKSAVTMFSAISGLIQGDADDLVSFIKRRK